jgi:hypothetical protein
LDKHTNSLAALTGILSFVILNIILHLPIRIFWSIAISLLLFILIKYLFGETYKQFEVTLPTFYSFDAFLIAVYFTLATVILLNAFSQNIPQFINWVDLPISSYLQFGASVIFTSFLPGYLILRISGTTRKMSGLAIFVFSLTLSLFLTASLFLLFVIFLRLDLFIFTIIFLLINLSLVVCQISRILVDSLQKDARIEWFHRSKYAGNKLYDIIIIALVILLTYSFVFSLLYYNSPLPYNDDWQQYGTTTRLFKFIQDSSVTEFFSSQSVGYFWSCSYIASTNLLSGFPPLNSYYLLHFLVILPLLCAYLAYRAWFSRVSPKLPAVATIFTMFGGFGGLYSLLTTGIVSWNSSNLIQLFQGLLTAGVKTFDINGLVVFYLAPFIAPAQIWGLTSFLLLIFLVHPKVSLGCIRWFLIGFTVAYGYLGHYAPEIFMFLILFLFLSLFLPTYTTSFVQKTGISALFGLIIVLASDFLLPVRLYSNDNAYVICLIIASVTIFVPYLKRVLVFLGAYVHRSKENEKVAISKISKFSKPLIFFSILYIFLLSIMIWINVLPSFEIGKTTSGIGTDFVPWYLYPIRLGVTGLVFLFVLFGLVISNRFRQKISGSFIMCFVLIILSFIVGKSFHFYPIYMESRLTTFMWFALSPIAAYALVYLSFRVKKLSKKAVSMVIITSILIIGFLSPTYYVEYLSILNETYVWFPYNIQVSKEEFGGLQFLYQHANANTTVLTVTYESRFLIASFGGIPLEHAFGGSPFARGYSQVFLQPSNVETVLNLLANSNVNYIYLASRDWILINTSYVNFKEGFVLGFLLDYLPITFQNSAVTIYRVPSLTAPNCGQSGLALLKVSPPKLDVNLSNDWIWGPTYGEIKQFNSSINDGSLEVSQTSGQDGNTWVVYMKMVNLTSDDYQGFAFSYNVLNSNATWLTVGLLSEDGQWVSYFDHLNSAHLEEVSMTLPPGENITEIRLYIESQPQTFNGTASQVSISNMFFEQRESSNYVFGSLALSQSGYKYTISSYDAKTFQNASVIFLLDDPSSWLPLMDWVKTGGHLIFLDCGGVSSFEDFLSLNISNETILANGLRSQNASLILPPLIVKKITSIDGTVWTSSYFVSDQGEVSSMTLNKKVSSGELTYVYLEPFISSLTEGNDSIKRDLFSELGAIIASLINTQSLTAEKSQDNWPEWAVGKISFQGEISLSTNEIGIANTTKIKQFKYDDSGNSFAVSNTTLEELEITGNSTVLAISNGTVTENQIEGDGIIQLQSSNFSIILGSGTALSVRFSNESATRILQNGQINIQSKYPITFNIQLPLRFVVNGSVYLNEAYLYKQRYIPLSELDPVLINGNTYFRTSLIDNGIVVFDVFRFSGNVEVTGYILDEPEWSEFTFDHSLLCSIQNVIIIILSAITTSFVTPLWKWRMRRRIVNQSGR